LKDEKEKIMSFEKVVLATVREVLVDVPSYAANFMNGSLFVECSVKEAVKLETALLAKLRCGIVLSRVGNESAFDFV
jgi:hypothetical protein